MYKLTFTATAAFWEPSCQDALLARAAKKTIITTERIVGTYRMKEEPKLTAIPHFLVEAVVELPVGPNRAYAIRIPGCGMA